MYILKRCLMVFFLIVTTTSMVAQSGIAKEDELKAAFIFNFVRFVEWPSSSFESRTAPLIIAVVGENPFGDVLEKLVSKESIYGHPLKVRHFKNVDDLSACHLLYVNVEDSQEAVTKMKTLRSKGVLLVSDDKRFMEVGGTVRFYTQQDKLRFEINLEVAQQAELKISSKLLKMALLY